MDNKLKQMIQKEQEFDLISEENMRLKEELKEYMYDSLCLRYEKARNAQMEADILKDRKDTGGIRQDHIVAIATRDKMRFYEILADAIGKK